MFSTRPSGMAPVWGLLSVKTSSWHTAAHCTPGTEPKEERPLLSPSPYPAKTKTMKALIVDDELSIRLALSHFLQGRGYEVQGAETGEGALSAAKTFLPDIVFLDWRLPDCDGEDLLKPLISPEIGALVVMMTGHLVLDNAISAMKNGADYYFPKPLDLNHVAVVLEKLEEKIKLSEQNEYFRRVSEMRGSDTIILGDSPQIIKVQRLSTLLSRNISTPV